MSDVTVEMMQLHLEILQTRRKRIEGKMTAALLRKDMSKNANLNMKIDEDKEMKKFESLEKEMDKVEGQIDVYENKALKVTAL